MEQYTLYINLECTIWVALVAGLQIPAVNCKMALSVSSMISSCGTQMAMSVVHVVSLGFTSICN